MRRLVNKTQLNKLKKAELLEHLNSILEIAEETDDISDFALNTIIYLETEELVDEIP